MGRRGHARSTPLIMRITGIFGSQLLARAPTSSVTPARGCAGSGTGDPSELEVRASCGAHRWVVGAGEEVGHTQRGALEGGSSTPIEGLGRTAPSSNLPTPNRRQVGDGPRGAHVGATKSGLREDLPPPGAHRALEGQAHASQGWLWEGLEAFKRGSLLEKSKKWTTSFGLPRALGLANPGVNYPDSATLLVRRNRYCRCACYCCCDIIL